MIKFLETSLHIKKNLIRRIKEAYSRKSLKLIKNKKQLISKNTTMIIRELELQS